jgi:aldehyde dehydrogenase (NAD+)
MTRASTTDEDDGNHTKSESNGHMHRTIEHLRHTFQTGRTKPIRWRLSQLEAMEHMLKSNRKKLVEAVHTDLGKPSAETSVMEIDVVLQEIRFIRRRIARWSSKKPVPMHYLMQPALSWTLCEPKGTVLIISPWNYPILLSLEPMVDAIAAGNCICLKPSEISPATSHVMSELLRHYLDTSAIAVIQGGPETSSALLEEHFDHIFYTGGSHVGQIVMEAASKNLTPVSLELGGKSPVFVDSTTHMNQAARRIAWGRFINAGQTCVAPDYVLVTHDAAEPLIHALAEAVTTLFGADPRNSNSYGRIISTRHVDRLAALLPDGKNPVAGHIVCGGNVDQDARYIAPTIITNVALDAPIMREEIFGPLLPVIEVDDATEAITIINGRPKPLALCVFTENRNIRRAFERETSSGALGFNIPIGHLISSRLPFGGVGASGLGAYHGKAGFDEFSHRKTIVSKPLIPDTLRVIYPPYHWNH